MRIRVSLLKYTFKCLNNCRPSEIDTNNTTERISLHLTDISLIGDLYPVVEMFFQKFKALKTLDIDLELFEKTVCSGYVYKAHL